MGKYTAVSVKKQIAWVKARVTDKEMKAALLQSLEVVAANNNPNDHSVVARLTGERARKFRKFLEDEGSGTAK